MASSAAGAADVVIWLGCPVSGGPFFRRVE